MESRGVVVEVLIQHSEAYSMTLRTWALCTAALPTTFSVIATFLRISGCCSTLAVVLQMFFIEPYGTQL